MVQLTEKKNEKKIRQSNILTMLSSQTAKQKLSNYEE
jgi:hypothetical protein